MKYIVMKIEEDIEFGCEERAENMPVQAVVTMKDDNGNVVVRRFADAELEKEDIQPDDKVFIDKRGKLCRVLEDDWTKNCTSQTVDIPRFVSMMEKVKAGKEVEWICPFCGGKVTRIEQEKGHTVIGCTSCDMRINLENN